MAAQPQAKCTSCSKALQGSWNMTKSGSNYDQTGRYLGINDGYFLYSGSPNWVYCYCLECWKKQILSLGFVKQTFQNIKSNLPQNFVQQLQEKKNKLSQEIQGIRTRLQQLNIANDVIEQSIRPIQLEINKIDEQVQVLQ
mmetsp:Transcript_19045/g.30233  ORF Transcript_19045/g.30233 Transcript_19045/m.30233 type:complete len:140 (+) Transcript_19045:35-454(+)